MVWSIEYWGIILNTATSHAVLIPFYHWKLSASLYVLTFLSGKDTHETQKLTFSCFWGKQFSLRSHSAHIFLKQWKPWKKTHLKLSAKDRKKKAEIKCKKMWDERPLCVFLSVHFYFFHIPAGFKWTVVRCAALMGCVKLRNVEQQMPALLPCRTLSVFVCEGVKTHVFKLLCAFNGVCVCLCADSHWQFLCGMHYRSGLNGADSDLDLMNFNPWLGLSR